jgi:hypothetical protein
MTGAARPRPWPVRRRVDAAPLARLGSSVGGWFTYSRCTRVRVHAREHRHERKGGERAWVRGAPWLEDGSPSLRLGAATPGGAPRGLSRERACKLDGDRVLAHPGRKAYPGGVASAHGGRYADELDLGRKLAKGTSLPCQAYAHTCVGARARAGACKVACGRTPISRPLRRPERQQQHYVRATRQGKPKKAR